MDNRKPVDRMCVKFFRIYQNGRTPEERYANLFRALQRFVAPGDHETFRTWLYTVAYLAGTIIGMNVERFAPLTTAWLEAIRPPTPDRPPSPDSGDEAPAEALQRSDTSTTQASSSSGSSSNSDATTTNALVSTGSEAAASEQSVSVGRVSVRSDLFGSSDESFVSVSPPLERVNSDIVVEHPIVIQSPPNLDMPLLDSSPEYSTDELVRDASHVLNPQLWRPANFSPTPSSIPSCSSGSSVREVLTLPPSAGCSQSLHAANNEIPLAIPVGNMAVFVAPSGPRKRRRALGSRQRYNNAKSRVRGQYLTKCFIEKSQDSIDLLSDDEVEILEEEDDEDDWPICLYDGPKKTPHGDFPPPSGGSAPSCAPSAHPAAC